MHIIELLLWKEFTINLFSVTTARRQQEVWDSELPVWHNIHCRVLPRADLQPRGWWVAVAFILHVTCTALTTIAEYWICDKPESGYNDGTSQHTLS